MRPDVAHPHRFWGHHAARFNYDFVIAEFNNTAALVT